MICDKTITKVPRNKVTAQNMQKNILKSDFRNTMFWPGFQDQNDGFCDVTEKLMTSSKKYDVILFILWQGTFLPIFMT